MKRKFYDIVFDKECIALGKQLGFERIICGTCRELNIELGGTLSKNRKAVRDKRVHILLDPVNATSGEFDTAIAQVAKDNNIAIGISINSILQTSGLDRVRILRNLRFMIKICLNKKASIILVSGAKNKYEMCSAQDLAAVGTILGLTMPQALWAISEVPEALLKR